MSATAARLTPLALLCSALLCACTTVVPDGGPAPDAGPPATRPSVSGPPAAPARATPTQLPLPADSAMTTPTPLQRLAVAEAEPEAEPEDGPSSTPAGTGHSNAPDRSTAPRTYRGHHHSRPRKHKRTRAPHRSRHTQGSAPEHAPARVGICDFGDRYGHWARGSSADTTCRQLYR